MLYRWAASDHARAADNFVFLALQAVALLGGDLPARAALVRAGDGAGVRLILVNLGYGQTVNDAIDTGKLAWMAGKSRQAGHAAAQFTKPLLFAGAQAAAAIALFVLARLLLRKGFGTRSIRFGGSGLALLLAPSLLVVPFGLQANAAERNLYSLGIQSPTPTRRRRARRWRSCRTPPARRATSWLVDESVAYAEFERLIAPRLAPYRPVDFGESASLANCSAPSNLALRSGVDVRDAGPHTDLRKMPSIWGYARKAGYRTELIDGQTKARRRT